MHFHGQQIGHENLKVVQPYARVSSASAKSGAIFFIIENGTNLEHKLIGAIVEKSKVEQSISIGFIKLNFLKFNFHFV